MWLSLMCWAMVGPDLSHAFVPCRFTEDTFKLTTGKGSVEKLDVSVEFLDWSGHLNRLVGFLCLRMAQ